MLQYLLLSLPHECLKRIKDSSVSISHPVSASVFRKCNRENISTLKVFSIYRYIELIFLHGQLLCAHLKHPLSALRICAQYVYLIRNEIAFLHLRTNGTSISKQCPVPSENAAVGFSEAIAFIASFSSPPWWEFLFNLMNSYAVKHFCNIDFHRLRKPLP